jgi:hypothetical protein
MSKQKTLLPVLSLVAAFILLLIFSLQYPFSSSFPMGADANVYIQLAQRLMNAPQAPTSALNVFKESVYPLTHTLFTFFVIIPTDWSTRFILWASLGQIMSGLALALLLYRFNGWPSAATGMAIWALTPITVNSHFEDGTIAQLWSLVFLLIFFERLLARSRWGAAIAFIATVLAHPITGAVLITSTLASSPLLIKLIARHTKSHLQTISYFTIFLLSLSIPTIISALQHPKVLSIITPSEPYRSLIEYLDPPFGLFVLLAPIGLLIMIKKTQRLSFFFCLLYAFIFFSVILAFNNFIGVGVWTMRLHTYFILSIAILSSIALPTILKETFNKTTVQIIFIVLLFSALSLHYWKNTSHVYAWYEDPGNYGRLLSEEKLAMEWMEDNLPTGSHILSTQTNRHSEWLKVFTRFPITDLESSDPIFHLQNEELHTFAQNHDGTQLIIFKYVEDMPEQIIKHPEWFPIIYDTKAISIINMPH